MYFIMATMTTVGYGECKYASDPDHSLIPSDISDKLLVVPFRLPDHYSRSADLRGLHADGRYCAGTPDRCDWSEL